MVTAILGASVDTGVLPPIVHAMIAYGAIACNFAAVEDRDRRARRRPAASSTRSTACSARDRGRSSRSPASRRTIAACGRCGSSELRVAAGEQVAIVGFDQPAAEVFVNLVTGATLPDAGEVACSADRPSAIADSAEWLAIVDRFGIVSERAVLLEQLTVVQNLAMPFTLEIEPPPDDVRERAPRRSRGRSGSPSRLDRAGRRRSTPPARARVRLAARSRSIRRSLLLEHASAGLAARRVAALGARDPRASRAPRVAVGRADRGRGVRARGGARACCARAGDRPADRAAAAAGSRSRRVRRLECAAQKEIAYETQDAARAAGPRDGRRRSAPAPARRRRSRRRRRKKTPRCSSSSRRTARPSRAPCT